MPFDSVSYLEHQLATGMTSIEAQSLIKVHDEIVALREQVRRKGVVAPATNSMDSEGEV